MELCGVKVQGDDGCSVSPWLRTISYKHRCKIGSVDQLISYKMLWLCDERPQFWIPDGFERFWTIEVFICSQQTPGYNQLKSAYHVERLENVIKV